MQYYAVIDTNVLVSAMLKLQSVPGRLAEAALLGGLTPLLCDEMIKEYREVLARPKFKFDQKAVEILIDGIIDRALFVKVPDLSGTCVLCQIGQVKFFKFLLLLYSTSGNAPGLKQYPAAPSVSAKGMCGRCAKAPHHLGQDQLPPHFPACVRRFRSAGSQ